MKIGIVIDSWKLSIFERHLQQAGVGYLTVPGPTSDTLLLQVDADDPGALQLIARAANTEAATFGPDEPPGPVGPRGAVQ